MRIGGLQKFSLIDYPGLISAVIFTQGCNFRCPYCHNPQLVQPERFEKAIDTDQILAFLNLRKDKIEGITITGGEPTVQKDLLCFMEKVKEGPFKLKLDTNGSRPDVIQTLLDNKLLDFVAMDIKSSPHMYSTLCGVPVNLPAILESVDLILGSGIKYLFRTTVVPNLFTDQMREQIKNWMTKLNANHIFQEFVHTEILDPSFLNNLPFNITNNTDVPWMGAISNGISQSVLSD